MTAYLFSSWYYVISAQSYTVALAQWCTFEQGGKLFSQVS